MSQRAADSRQAPAPVNASLRRYRQALAQTARPSRSLAERIAARRRFTGEVADQARALAGVQQAMRRRVRTGSAIRVPAPREFSR